MRPIDPPVPEESPAIPKVLPLMLLLFPLVVAACGVGLYRVLF